MTVCQQCGAIGGFHKPWRPVCDVYPSCPGSVAVVPEQCASVNDGDRCDLPAGHVGRHEHIESRTWEPGAVALEDLFPPRKDER